MGPVVVRVGAVVAGGGEEERVEGGARHVELAHAVPVVEELLRQAAQLVAGGAQRVQVPGQGGGRVGAANEHAACRLRDAAQSGGGRRRVGGHGHAERAGQLCAAALRPLLSLRLAVGHRLLSPRLRGSGGDGGPGAPDLGGDRAGGGLVGGVKGAAGPEGEEEDARVAAVAQGGCGQGAGALPRRTRVHGLVATGRQAGPLRPRLAVEGGAGKGALRVRGRRRHPVCAHAEEAAPARTVQLGAVGGEDAGQGGESVAQERRQRPCGGPGSGHGQHRLRGPGALLGPSGGVGEVDDEGEEREDVGKRLLQGRGRARSLKSKQGNWRLPAPARRVQRDLHGAGHDAGKDLRSTVGRAVAAIPWDSHNAAAKADSVGEGRADALQGVSRGPALRGGAGNGIQSPAPGGGGSAHQADRSQCDELRVL